MRGGFDGLAESLYAGKLIMQTLAELIREHAAAEATAGDWQAVAEILQSIVSTSEPRECQTVETADALIAVGENPNALIAVLAKDPTGNFLLSKLAQSGRDAQGNAIGVAWAHRLTVPYLQAGVDAGLVSQTAMTALVDLSQSKTHPLSAVTADDCSSAWLTGADVLLSVNRTGVALRISLNVSRNGQQVRLASLTKGQGSEADQALLAAVEIATDAWLQAGG
tara:strand:+ start:42 stop:710 length:669 start_codon:yes stop_codon:yes gene_type:complete